jgi:hypothetical protein
LRDDHYRERVESFLHTSSIDVKNVMCTLSTEAAAGFEKTLAYSQAIDEGFTESWARDQFLVGGVRGDSDEGGDNDGDDGTLRKRRRQLVRKATANPNYALNFAAALRSERDKDAAAAGAGAGGDGGFGATGGASTRFSSSSPPLLLFGLLVLPLPLFPLLVLPFFLFQLVFLPFFLFQLRFFYFFFCLVLQRNELLRTETRKEQGSEPRLLGTA